MFISVIIPTRNRQELLSIALDSLLYQTIEPEEFEVIVIDNGSTDNTALICKEYENKFHSLTYAVETNDGLHNARHRGLDLAKGDILAYIDDDVKTFPTWLNSIKKAFQDSNVVLVGGKVLPDFQSSPPWWISKMWTTVNNNGKTLGFLSLIDLGDEIKKIHPIFVFGCNFSIRKHILLEAGGFHPDSLPQNLIICRGDGECWTAKYIFQKGYTALYHPKASVYHIIPPGRLTIEYFCKRAFNEGISTSYNSLRYPLPLHLHQDEYEQNQKQKRQSISIKSILIKILRFLKLLQIKEYKFTKIMKQINLCQENGFKYHNELALKNPVLMEWVKRKTYFSASAFPIEE